MCRMSLVASIGPELSTEAIQLQATHLKAMAGGASGLKYGDATGSSEYDATQIIHHEDGVGHYVGGNGKENYVTYNRSVVAIDKTKFLPAQGDISIMHARLATSGNKNPVNLQPFNLENIVGSHNGTVGGLSKGEESDSVSIFHSLNSYVANHSFDVSSFEKHVISEIVNHGSSYSALNLIFYLKREGKVIVLCSYNDALMTSRRSREYYTLIITRTGKMVYVASEPGAFSGSSIATENHTVYVIDKKTGKITSYKLSDLERAVNKKFGKARMYITPRNERKDLEGNGEENAGEKETGRRNGSYDETCTQCQTEYRTQANPHGKTAPSASYVKGYPGKKHASRQKSGSQGKASPPAKKAA